jgi:hypothetical protein
MTARRGEAGSLARSRPVHVLDTPDTDQAKKVRRGEA